MIQYQFCFIHLPSLGDYSEICRVGQKKFSSLNEALKELGEQGWSIGTSRIDNASGIYQIIMQRPKE